MIQEAILAFGGFVGFVAFLIGYWFGQQSILRRL